ncbi:flagellar motor switch protein FliM [Opitutus terrae]|uniref:Flagellar motor switch protein FliM n=1 Tax=Opitutus terrae (strain DSM 11246 / JCM 15787 / PB90-1) TaxID=452637 RepID=B1ZR35_OPITP|nr:FliM/FliN family flagellar motor switch protein [Opitutus terrae]ACB73702.1 flagellar motor switch protein FliM [Opitutus terrae PB90-1]
MADDPSNSTGSILDQSEIDKLLAQEMAVAPPKQFLLRPEGARGPTPVLKVEPYDFRNPVFLSEVELRRLRLLHEDFIRYLAARLSLYLRMELGLKMAKLTTATYAKFTDSLPSPTHLCLFKVEPLIGVGILDINPRLALTIADRLLGGRGHSVKAERYLTEIEIALLEDVVNIVLEEWCTQWKTEQELRPQIIGHENNGRFLQTSPKDAIVLILTLEANFGDCSEQIQIGVPYYTIEPVVKKMQARRQKDTAVSTTAKKAEWQAAYEHIKVPVRAEWSAMDISLREVVSLRVGDVFELPASIFHETRVLLNNVPKFVGTVGLDSDRVAVQLTRKTVPGPANPLKSDGRKSP